jgi:5'-nucleotidase
MERRSFVKKSIFVTGGVIITGNSLAASMKPSADRFTILHTNDTHSNIDPLPMNHAKYPGMGGVAKRMQLIQSIRAFEDQVLLLDAGDIFQGTPYFNRFGGKLELQLMSKLGYDAATMGNHDFDAGLHGFLAAKKHATFPFLCANYDFGRTVIDGQTRPHQIFKKGRITVGVFGVGVELKGLVPDSKFEQTMYLDPIATANEQASLLRSKGCDIVICLSHLGFEYPDERISDRKLAKSTSGIDLIIGGHTHTFLKEPVVELNNKGRQVVINQVGWGGVQMGRIDFELEKSVFKGNKPLIIK